MSYQNSVISAPVSIRDVQRCFGSGKTDLGSLIRGVTINKWAKYKPVRFATVQLLTEANLIAVNYGIVNIPTWQRLDRMATFLFSNSRGSLNNMYWPECDQDAGHLATDYWEYLVPEGGASQPFRLADFKNYYHDADEPIGPIIAPSNTIEIQPIGTMHIYFTYGAQLTFTLKLSDLTWPGSTNFPIGNMYFGVLMKQLTGNHAGVTYAATMKVNDQDIDMNHVADHGYHITIPADNVDAGFEGTWTIFPIISSVVIPFTNQFASFTGEKFIAPLPAPPAAITVHINYAELLITNAIGYRDPNSQQRNVVVVVALQNSESVPRNGRVSVKLFDRYGVEKTSYAASQSVTLQGDATTSLTFTIYIADIWNDMEGGKFSVTSSIDLSLSPVKFYRDNNWPQTTLAESRPL